MNSANLYIVDHNVNAQMMYQELFSDKSCAIYSNAEQLLPDLAQQQQNQPAVILAALFMPYMSGLELLRWCQQQQMHLPVVIIDHTEDVTDIAEVYRSGGYAFFLRPFNEQMLYESVMRAYQHSQHLVEQKQKREIVLEKIHHLTRQESKILDALLELGTSEQIARKLNISLNTVNVHRYSILKKLRMDSFNMFLLKLASVNNLLTEVRVALAEQY